MTKPSLESMLFRLDSSTNQTGKLLPPLEIHRDGQVSKACQRSKDFYLSCLQNGVSIVPLDKFLNIDENEYVCRVECALSNIHFLSSI